MDKKSSCISVKTLYETYGENLTFCFIAHIKEDDNHYYDLIYNGHCVCLDGESCSVIQDDRTKNRVLLVCHETGVPFLLTDEEYSVASFGEVIDYSDSVRTA